MSVSVNMRLLLVWVVLSALTVVYVWLDHGTDQDGSLKASSVVTVGAIAIALIKVRIIFREFMEVRHAPAWLCRLTDGWVVLIGTALIGTYLVGSALSA